MVKKPQPILTPEQAEELIGNRELRLAAAKASKLAFALIYFPHYFTLPAADFHPELFALLQKRDGPPLALAGFRGSAKSTIAGMVDVLYEALINKSPFIIPVNDTTMIVKVSIHNLRDELENNELLRSDFGDMINDNRKGSSFTETNVLLSNGVRIMGRSRGQKIRGLRHKQYRPSYVSVDDTEEKGKIGKKEYRDKTENWLLGDVIPAMEESKGRLVVLGNMLHTDGLMARLKNNPVFEYHEFALFKGEECWENCTWKGKYPTPESIERQKAKVGYVAWMREYLLKVVPPEGQEVPPDWIQYYDHLPKISAGKSGVGVDLAISKNEKADFTTMVSGVLSIDNGMPKIFVLPSPVNAHLSMLETMEQMKSIHLGLRLYAHPTFYIEAVAYQKAAVEEAQRRMLAVKAIMPGGDKRARLRTAGTFIQNGTVVFPRRGCEDLIAQLLGFGIEDHDDLVDALVYLILGLADEGMQMPEVVLL